MSAFSLLLITDPAYEVEPITARALDAAAPGEVAVMLRDKSATGRELAERARRLLAICRPRGAPLLVNGRADVARATGADGAHLPEQGLTVADARAVLGPNALIGASRHADADADADPAPDYITLSPVRSVPDKAPPLGIDGFAANVPPGIPTYALGGVTAELAGDLIRAGAAGVAVMRAVYAADDPAGATRALLAAMRG